MTKVREVHNSKIVRLLIIDDMLRTLHYADEQLIRGQLLA